MFEGAAAEFAGAQLPTALAPGLLGPNKVARGPSGAHLPEKPQQVEQGAAASSKLFALPWLPGAQAPFLVNILAGRTKNNSVCPLRGIEAQSQELCWWG